MSSQGYWVAGPDEPAEFVLRRVPGQDGSYHLLSQFRYVDRAGEQWTIPAEPGQEFETDLASIPSLAAWLVPKDGRHTPAALVHDAMILSPGETHCYAGRVVGAAEADRIFRLGMQFLGVKFWRRWMIWAAVSILTIWRSAGRPGPARLTNMARLVVTLVTAGVIGLFLLPDVLDIPELPSFPLIPDSIPVLRGIARWGPLEPLWHLEEAGFWTELGRFATVVVAFAAVATAAWGRRWRFGACVGLTVPLIAWPTAVGAAAFGIYAAIEFLISLVLLAFCRSGRDTGRVPASLLAQRLTGTGDGGRPSP